MSMYGFCPFCKAEGILREKRPNGDDRCSNGHSYPSSSARTTADQPRLIDGWNEQLEAQFLAQIAISHPNLPLTKVGAGEYSDPRTRGMWYMFRDGALWMAKYSRDLLTTIKEQQNVHS